MEKADAYFTAGNYNEAEIEYLNVLQIESLNPQAISRLGLIYYDQGRVGRVMPYLLKARELSPDNLDIHLKLGLIFLSIGDHAKAREEANLILKRNPQDPGAPLLLAEASLRPEDSSAAHQQLSSLPQTAPVLVALGGLAFHQQHLPEAEKLFRDALVQDPKFAAAEAALGTLFRVQNLPSAAEQAFSHASALAPTHSSLQLVYARFKVQTGDLPGARAALQKIITQTPDYLPALLLQAEIASAEKKYPEASDLIARILALDAAHPDALLLGARLKIAQGQNQKAVEDLEKLAKLYSRSPQIRYYLGLAYSNTDESSKAISSVEQALVLAPNYSEATVLLAELNLKKGDLRTTVLLLKKAVEQHPDFVQGRFMLADAYRRQGNLDDAIAAYVQLEKLLPRDPQALNQHGAVLAQQNKRDEARQAFNKALELAPGFLPSVEQLVDLDLKDKNVAAAQHRVDEQIARDPKSAGPYLLQAKIHLLTSDQARAETSLRKAIELQPDAVMPYLLLARMYATTHQLEKALAGFQAVLAKNPKNVEALMLVANIYGEQGNFTAARDNYEALLSINPRFSPALNNLAYLYSEKFNQLDKALALAQRARDLLPYEPHTADTLGWIMYQKKQFPRAVGLLTESAVKLPDSGDVQFHVGMAHYMIGNEQPARAALERALQLEKDFPGRGEAERSLMILSINPDAADARERLEKLTKENPGDIFALTRLAAAQVRQGAAEQGLATYRRVLELSPNNVPALIGMIQVNLGRGEKAKALEFAKNARKLAPDNLEVLHLLGRLAYETGDYPWSFSLLQEAARKNSDDPVVLYDFAEAAYSNGRIAEAETAMRRGLDLDSLSPRAEDARRFLEMTALAASPAQAAGATARVDQLLKSNPDFVPALMARATAGEKNSDANGVRAVYEKILGIYPGFSPAARSLAIFLAENSDESRRAYDLGTKARESFPDDLELTRALGIASVRLGDFSRAVTLLQKSGATRSQDGTLQYYLGVALQQLKRPAESRAALQRALDLKLRPDLVNDAQRRLAELKA